MTAVTVFIADDHAIVHDGLVAHLAAQPDIRVVGTASDGREIIDAIRAVQTGRRYLSAKVAEISLRTSACEAAPRRSRA